MNHLRSTLALACLGLLTAAAGAQPAQPSRRSLGITDLMRAGPQLAPAPARAPAQPAAAPVRRSAEYIVALVNSEPITNSDVQQRMLRALEGGNPELQRMPRDELARQVLERLISERAQLQLAKESGVKVDEAAIDQAEQTVARQNQITSAELRRRISADGIPIQEFRGELRNQLLMQRLRERELEPKVKVSDAEIDDYLREQRNGGGVPEVNIAQVLVAVPESANEAQVASLQRKAEGIVQRARAGEDFATLARDLSDSPDKANGGALGLRSVDRYPQLFLDATQSTAVGGVAGPVRSGAGFHVLKVLAKSSAGAGDVMVPQVQVRHILLRNDGRRTTEQAIAELRDFKRRVQAGTADFAGLARDNSQDGSAQAGGDLGWRRSSDFVPEFEEAVGRMAPGEISDPVVSRFGVHLIQLQGRRESRLTTAEQREAARAALREKRIDDAYEAWLQEVRGRAYVEYREPPQS